MSKFGTFLFVTLVGACTITASQAAVIDNGLSTNGLSTNGLSTNGLSTNGLSTNGLSTNGLSTNGASATGSINAATGRLIEATLPDGSLIRLD